MTVFKSSRYSSESSSSLSSSSCSVGSDASPFAFVEKGCEDDFAAGVEGMCTLPTDETNATNSTPRASLRYFSAIAPAATRPMVSLALERPPPLLAFKPYLSR